MISSISKWDGSRNVNRPDAFICGDTLSDLRTKDNELSVWKADTPNDIEDAIVALALGRDSVSKVAYFLLDEKELEKREIQVSDQNSGCAAGLDESILSKHRDLVELDYWRLGYLAQYMLALAENQINRRDYSRKAVKSLLEKYKAKNLISVDLMNQSLRRELKW